MKGSTGLLVMKGASESGKEAQERASKTIMTYMCCNNLFVYCVKMSLSFYTCLRHLLIGLIKS